MARGEASVCLACGKKFDKKDYAIQCTICSLWVHKTCAGISDELFAMIDLQHKETGTAYWACRACTVYAKGMTTRMREVEKQLEKVQTACNDNAGGLKNVREVVDKLADKVECQNKKIEAAATVNVSEVYEEIRDREARRANVVMYGMGEAPDEMTGFARWDWDMQSCRNLFEALGLDIQQQNVKFCRRVGDTETRPRPLVVGFYEEKDKIRVQRCDTRNTTFSNVEIGPDQTKKQKQEELEMKAEAVRRNRELGDTDRAKNLAWLVVGPRGEKRLVKKYVSLEAERGEAGSRGGWRGGPRGRRSYQPTRGGPRGRGWPVRGGGMTTAIPAENRGTGANTTPLGGDGMEEMEYVEEEGEVGEENGATSAPGPVRGRGRGRPTRLMSQKRKEMEESQDKEAEPPAKH
jgi:hypothetical protein